MLISFLRFFVVTSIYFAACQSVAEKELAVIVVRRTSLAEFAEQAGLSIRGKHLTAGRSSEVGHIDSGSHITGVYINECRVGQTI